MQCTSTLAGTHEWVQFACIKVKLSLRLYARETSPQAQHTFMSSPSAQQRTLRSQTLVLHDNDRD